MFDGSVRYNVEWTADQKVSDLNVLESDKWPIKNTDGSGRSDGAKDDGCLLYGEQNVVRMAKRFHLNTRSAVEQFRRFKDGKKPETELSV